MELYHLQTYNKYHNMETIRERKCLGIKVIHEKAFGQPFANNRSMPCVMPTLI